jgi:hypothetical protein
MNTIIIHPTRRSFSPFDAAMREIADVMFRPQWVEEPIPWWVSEGCGINGMEMIDEEIVDENGDVVEAEVVVEKGVEKEEEADSDAFPFSEIDAEAQFSWLQGMLDREEWEFVQDHNAEEPWSLIDDNEITSFNNSGLGICIDISQPASGEAAAASSSASSSSSEFSLSGIEYINKGRERSGNTFNEVSWCDICSNNPTYSRDSFGFSFSFIENEPEQEPQSGPGLPPSISLPPLPSSPPVIAQKRGKRARVLQKVKVFMHRAAEIGKGRKKERREVDGDC